MAYVKVIFKAVAKDLLTNNLEMEIGKKTFVFLFLVHSLNSLQSFFHYER